MGNSNSLSARMSGNAFLRYALALVSALAASLICGSAPGLIVRGSCYVLLLLAVAFSAWYGGIGPSTVVVAVGLLEAVFGFIPKIHSFARPGRPEAAGVLIFVLSSAAIVAMGDSRRRHNAVLLKALSELEERVRERTADLNAANANLRQLSARLMQLQDEERRRIARELHDSVGQTLAALAMNLSLVRGDVERLARIASALSDSENLVREMSTEVRTISHLLHPPLLDEAGLSSAIRWYVDGFAQRSRIQVDLDIPDDLERLPRELETAVFRVVQECLTNIHRHSGSPVARIHLRRRRGQVVVEIADKGKGIPLEKQEELASAGTPGVGIRGMRERLRQLGGNLDIASSDDGTTVTVDLPIGETSGAERIPLEGSAVA